jgi:hypothetical protein
MSDLNPPCILLVDDDPARIEHLENLFYRQGYETHTVSPAELEQGAKPPQVSLVVTYSSLDPGWSVGHDSPVLAVLPADSPEPQSSDHDDPPVVHLPYSATTSVLLEMMAALLGPESERPKPA